MLKIEPAVKYMAKNYYDGCKYFSVDDQNMATGYATSACDCCHNEMIDYTAPSSKISQGDLKSLEYDMREVCEAIGLKERDNVDYLPEGSNIEDYSDEYQCVCSDCYDDIMQKFYNEEN